MNQIMGILLDAVLITKQISSQTCDKLLIIGLMLV